MKKIYTTFLCLFLLFSMAGCLGFDEKLITQKEAQQLAENLTGGEVTYVGTEEVSETEIIYTFTDSKGVTFPITSGLRQQSIDDGAPFGPYDCWVTDDYEEVVLTNNKEAALAILETYGLADYVNYIDAHGINLKFYEGTPEENRSILEQAAAAGAEIDALLDMTYNRDYDEEIRNDKYYSYSSNLYTTFRLNFYRKFEDADITELCIDVANPVFSVSDSERWTAETLYQAILEDIDTTEIAE